MVKLSSRAVRYARAWIAGPHDVVDDEITLDRDGTRIPATIVRPRSMPPPLPTWIVLHGITRPGRAHAQLVRFTRSVASAGMATIVPDVPEWRELSLAPHLTVPTVAAAVRGIRDTGLVRGDRLGLVGFSFGAPHAIAACADPRVHDDIAGVCGFGGYCSLERTVRFMITGHHEWAGRSYRRRPDPYGRWIVAANYLTAAPDHADAGDVADALRTLARHSGDVGAPSWDPVYRPKIRELRARVSAERRELFDRFARSERDEGSDERDVELAEAIAEGARRRDPAVDPVAAFGDVKGRVHLLHGRADHLIPFTESHRLREALGDATVRHTVTRLFAHSNQERLWPWTVAAELPRFAWALSDLLTTV